ncbi:hypothetical protein BU17DRAFT_86555 [Hysterangium stoloniferum]|nr:hypothetical protein BU17DRAFT_86555 [Hysterangium stoloniferum]
MAHSWLVPYASLFDGTVAELEKVAMEQHKHISVKCAPMLSNKLSAQVPPRQQYLYDSSAAQTTRLVGLSRAQLSWALRPSRSPSSTPRHLPPRRPNRRVQRMFARQAACPEDPVEGEGERNRRKKTGAYSRRLRQPPMDIDEPEALSPTTPTQQDRKPPQQDPTPSPQKRVPATLEALFTPPSAQPTEHVVKPQRPGSISSQSRRCVDQWFDAVSWKQTSSWTLDGQVWLWEDPDEWEEGMGDVVAKTGEARGEGNGYGWEEDQVEEEDTELDTGWLTNVEVKKNKKDKEDLYKNWKSTQYHRLPFLHCTFTFRPAHHKRGFYLSAKTVMNWFRLRSLGKRDAEPVFTPVEKPAAGPQLDSYVGGPSASSSSTVGQPEPEPPVQVIVTNPQNQDQAHPERDRDGLRSPVASRQHPPSSIRASDSRTPSESGGRSFVNLLTRRRLRAGRRLWRVTKVLQGMIQRDSEFKYWCIRPKKGGYAAVALMGSAASNGVDKRSLPVPSQLSSAAGGMLRGLLMRQQSSQVSSRRQQQVPEGTAASEAIMAIAASTKAVFGRFDVYRSPWT